MSPNAMDRERSSQITQLEGLHAATKSRLTTCNKALEHLTSAVTQIDSIGKIPALNDVHKIAAAIKCLAQAQIVQAELNVVSLNAESKTIEDAINQAKSPIARVGIIR